MTRFGLLVGVPRAGTTLTSGLLNSLENAVCLAEPEWQLKWARKTDDRAELARRILQDFPAQHARILRDKTVEEATGPDGAPITDYFLPGRSRVRADKRLVAREDRTLTADFLLSMKHNAPYLGVLDLLVGDPRFTCLGLVRDPVDVLASWRSLDLPVSSARLPAAERAWPEIRDIAGAGGSLLERQARLLDAIFARLQRFSGQLHLLKYEDVVRRPDLVAEIMGRPFRRRLPIRPSRNKDLLPAGDRREIARAVARFCPAAAGLYPDRFG